MGFIMTPKRGRPVGSKDTHPRKKTKTLEHQNYELALADAELRRRPIETYATHAYCNEAYEAYCNEA